MLIYRSIGERELFQLLNGNIIYGQYDCSAEKQNSSKKTNAICCFVEKYFWKDSKHKFFVILDIPNNQIELGKGIYYASKNLSKTKIWSGRKGNTVYEIQEAYIDKYSYKNVCTIYLGNYYANWYMNKHILPKIEKYNLNVIDFSELSLLLLK